jgi:hypothetical protein
MSNAVSVFSDFHGELSVLLACLSEVLGSSLAKEEYDAGTVYRGRILDTEVLLLDLEGQGLEDNDQNGIALTRYRYQLQLTAFEASRAMAGYEALYASMATFIAERLARTLECRSEVVANLSSSVAVFGA